MLLAAILSCQLSSPPAIAEAVEAPAPMPQLTGLDWSIDGDLPRGDQARAFTTMDAALYAVPGLVLSGPAGAPAPLVGVPHEPHTLQVEAHGHSLTATLCDPTDACVTGAFQLDVPERTGLDVASWAAAQLGTAVPDAVQSCLDHTPDDRYTAKILGRAARVHVGVADPNPFPGDTARDPVARAVFLDSSLAIAQHMRATHATDPGVAARHARYASNRCRSHEGWVASAQHLSSVAGDRVSAWPDDERFLLAQLDHHLRHGLPAADLAQEAMLRFPGEADVVRRAAATQTGSARTELLAEWSALAPDDPAAELLLAEQALSEGRWADVVEHGNEALDRGADDEANELMVPALLALGHLDEASERAPERLKALVAARQGGSAESLGPEGLLLEASRQLDDEPGHALDLAVRALDLRPDWPEALALAAEAARRSGADPEPFEARLALVEP